MSIIEERLVALNALRLESGSHASLEEGACIMECVSYVAGEPWSDHPECASKVLTTFCVRWNDRLNDEDRQMLKPYIPRLVGTRTTDADEVTRAWMCVDWLVHEATPAYLRAAGLTDHAEALEGLAAITDASVFAANRGPIDAARKDARAKRDAAEAAGAAWAAWAAGVAWAAWAAEAAWAAWAAGVAWAAGAAEAAGAAWAAGAEEAAEVAGVAWAAEAAEQAAVKSEADGGDWYAQRRAARDAARPHFDRIFQPITKGLQQSALGLLDRMIEVGR